MQMIDSIDWKNWQAQEVATLTFIIKNAQVLLIHKKRGLGAGKINAPGGKQEKNETLLECAIREVQEEVCVTPLSPRYHCECRFHFLEGIASHTHVFVANDYKGTPKETEEAIPFWVSIDAIPYDNMWEDDRIWLPKLLEGQPCSGDYLFDAETLLDFQLHSD